MTPAEKILWEFLRANRLGGYHFRRQQLVEGFIIDFYCHRCRLAIEVDGKVHEQTQERDRRRDGIIRNKGLHILRFQNQAIENDLENVINRILEMCYLLSPKMSE